MRALKIVAVCVVLLLMLANCSKSVYVPLQSVSKDTVVSKTEVMDVQIAARIDSVVVRDSVVMVIRGDTVIKEVWRERLKTNIKRDTVWMHEIRDSIRTHCDTVSVPVAVPQNKTEKSSASGLSSFLTKLLLVGIAAVIMYVARRQIRKQ